jgi:hypothetical protein
MCKGRQTSKEMKLDKILVHVGFSETRDEEGTVSYVLSLDYMFPSVLCMDFDIDPIYDASIFQHISEVLNNTK